MWTPKAYGCTRTAALHVIVQVKGELFYEPWARIDQSAISTTSIFPFVHLHCDRRINLLAVARGTGWKSSPGGARTTNGVDCLSGLRATTASSVMWSGNRCQVNSIGQDVNFTGLGADRGLVKALEGV